MAHPGCQLVSRANAAWGVPAHVGGPVGDKVQFRVSVLPLLPLAPLKVGTTQVGPVLKMALGNGSHTSAKRGATASSLLVAEPWAGPRCWAAEGTASLGFPALLFPFH